MSYCITRIIDICWEIVNFFLGRIGISLLLSLVYFGWPFVCRSTWRTLCVKIKATRRACARTYAQIHTQTHTYTNLCITVVIFSIFLSFFFFSLCTYLYTSTSFIPHCKNLFMIFQTSRVVQKWLAIVAFFSSQFWMVTGAFIAKPRAFPS